MHGFSYAIVFIANIYTAIKIFGLGWSTQLPSFASELSVVALITLITGSVAAVPVKSDWKIITICSAIGPCLVSGLMAQGILQNGAFHLFHWLLIPIGGAVISCVSFLASRQLIHRRK